MARLFPAVEDVGVTEAASATVQLAVVLGEPDEGGQHEAVGAGQGQVVRAGLDLAGHELEAGAEGPLEVGDPILRGRQSASCGRSSGRRAAASGSRCRRRCRCLSGARRSGAGGGPGGRCRRPRRRRPPRRCCRCPRAPGRSRGRSGGERVERGPNTPGLLEEGHDDEEGAGVHEVG